LKTCHKTYVVSVSELRIVKTTLIKENAIMKKNRITILIIMAFLALALAACNNPLLAANAEGASDIRAEIEAQVQAALEEAESSSEPDFMPDDGPVVVVNEQEAEEEIAEAEEEEVVEPEVEPEVTVEPAPEIEVCTDRAEFIADVTVPDGSDFTPGQAFVKTWRLRNAGTCTWTSSYDLIFDHGDAMGGPASQALLGLVHPGETVDLSIDLTAPSAEGGYQGYWLLRNSEGMIFGIGVNANIAFWVEIEVLEEEEEDDDPLILELAPIHVFPLFVSSGSGQTLPAGGCFDLDAGSMIACGSAAADFGYSTDVVMEGFPPTLEMVFRIQPRHGARFAFFGSDLPTGSECQAAGLSTSAFNVQSKVYCYQTDAGKYGYLKIVGRDLTHMSFDWGTYTLP
jgi:hypothetical protein